MRSAPYNILHPIDDVTAMRDGRAVRSIHDAAIDDGARA
jgi:hypothetical protein